MSEYKNFAKLRKLIKAPLPAFALTEERANDPAYQEIRRMQDHPIDFVRGEIETGVDDYLGERGLPKSTDVIAADMTFGDVADSSNVVGGVIKAPTAAKAVGQAAKEAPSAFGRILQVVKEEAVPAEKAVKKFGKIIYK